MIYYSLLIFEVNDHSVHTTFRFEISDLELNTSDDTFRANSEMHITGLTEMPSSVLRELWTFGIEGPAHLITEMAAVLVLAVHTIHEKVKSVASLSLIFCGVILPSKECSWASSDLRLGLPRSF